MKIVKHSIWIIKNLLHILAWIVQGALLLPAALFCLLGRIIQKPYDVGLGPLPMINNVYWKRALIQQGFRVETYATERYFITDEFDYIFDRGFKRIFRANPLILFVWTALRYRCVYVYFNGGPLQTLPGIRLLEPLLYHVAGTKTVVMPYGSDCQIFERTPNKLMVNALCADYPTFFRTHHAILRRQVEWWTRYSDFVIGAMDSVDYEFFWDRLMHCHYAIDINCITPTYPVRQKGIIRVFHAPNHKQIKGSEHVEQVMAELQNEGYPVELVTRHGVSNEEIHRTIEECDIVIDQLVIGWYAMFALEAMAHGKPTICYLRSDLLKLYEQAGCVLPGEIPLFSAECGTLKQVLIDLINRREEWEEIGRRNRVYVEKYHSLEHIGKVFADINCQIGILPSNAN